LLWVVGLVVLGYLFGNIPVVQQNLNTLVLIGIWRPSFPSCWAPCGSCGARYVASARCAAPETAGVRAKNKRWQPRECRSVKTERHFS
jgi:hypothetical protein